MPSLFIDGQWVASGDGQCSPVVNPSDATRRHRGRRRHRRPGPAGDRRRPPGLRRDRLAANADRAIAPPSSTASPALIDRDREEIARARDAQHRQGPARELLGHDDVTKVFRYYADLADKEAGRLVDTGTRTRSAGSSASRSACAG